MKFERKSRPTILILSQVKHHTLVPHFVQLRFSILFLGGRFQSQEPNTQLKKESRYLDQNSMLKCTYLCCVVIRICYRYPLVISPGIYALTRQGWKTLKTPVLVQNLGSQFCFEKTNFLVFSSLLVLSWKLSVLWCFWNNWNRQISDSDFLLKILEATILWFRTFQRTERTTGYWKNQITA